MKLESLNSELFAPVSNTESAGMKGGMAETTYQTVYSNCWISADYVVVDRDIFTDEGPATVQPVTGMGA